jgi:ATP phosphoribosyltransferase regulatory subunit
MRISSELPLGVHALLFDSARRRRRLETELASVLGAAGFEEVILPILDYFEPYGPLLTPAGRGELYRFVDRDGELLALRADSTPMLARLLAPRLATLPLPLRLFYRGDVVRYEEERAGRQREFYEMGAELLGLPGECAEREMLRLFLELLSCAAGGVGVQAPVQPAGESPIQVVLGFAGALDTLLSGAGADDPAQLAAAVARRERGLIRHRGNQSKGAEGSLPGNQSERARGSLPNLSEHAGSLPSVWTTLAAIVENGLPALPEELGEPAAGRLRGLLAMAGELASLFPAVRLSVDLAEFAGQVLDPRLAPPHSAAAHGERPYYDGLVFRAYAGVAALPVGGGGRYDGLFRSLGADVPAVGFSLGLDRLLQAGGLMPERAPAEVPAGGAARVTA